MNKSLFFKCSRVKDSKEWWVAIYKVSVIQVEETATAKAPGYDDQFPI